MEYKDLVGKAYRNGGRGNDAYDSWGLVIEIYRRQGITLNDYPISFDNSTEENISGIVNTEKKEWKEIKEPIAGCVIVISSFDGWSSHVGVCISEYEFIHSAVNKGVTIERIKRWDPFIVGFYVPGETYDKNN